MRNIDPALCLRSPVTTLGYGRTVGVTIGRRSGVNRRADSQHGTDTSRVEVVDVSAIGFTLVVDGRRFAVPFSGFPWFDGVPAAKLGNVKVLHRDHLYWPDLDVDLSLECIEHPERFPLISKQHSTRQRE